MLPTRRRTNSARYIGPALEPVPTLPYRLLFILPSELGPVCYGSHQPSKSGPVLTVDIAGLVTITGRSRGEVFAHAAKFLRLLSKNKPPATLVATLVWPPGVFAKGPHEDHWSFAVGADVSWVPSPLGAEIATG